MMQKFQTLLAALAPLLEEEKILWAVGGSVMLFYHGLEPAPRDIDLLVNPQDAAAADKVLTRIGAKAPPSPHARYGTEHFYEYRIWEADVDLIGGFTIHHEAGECKYLLRPEELVHIPVEGTTIPLCPMEDWYVLYLLMNREQRAAAIEKYFAAHPANRKILSRWQAETLPAPIQSRTGLLLEKP